MAATKAIAGISLERITKLKRSSKQRLFVYPDNLKEEGFIEATEECLARGNIVARTTKIMPTQKNKWKSEKGRHLKFLLPEGADLSDVLAQFDAGELEAIVLQTPKHHVAILGKYKFLDDIVPFKHTLVNGDVGELTELLKKFCEPLPAVTIRKAPLPSPSPVEQTEDDGDQQPSSEDEDDEEQQSSDAETEQEQPLPGEPMETDEEVVVDDSQKEVIEIPSGPSSEDEDEDPLLPMETDAPDEPVIQELPDDYSADEDELVPHSKQRTVEKQLVTRTPIMVGRDGAVEPARTRIADVVDVIYEHCDHKGPGPCKWHPPPEEASVVDIEALRKRKKSAKGKGGPKRDTEKDIKIRNSVKKLVDAQRRKGGPFPRRPECVLQAQKDGVTNDRSTISKMAGKCLEEELRSARRNKELDSEDRFIVR